MATTPVAWLATLMRDGNDSDFFRKQQVDDAVWKAAQRHAAVCAAPRCAEFWLHAKQLYRALKLGDNCKAKLDIRLLRLKAGTRNEFFLRLGRDRYLP